jgi:hypothetical protein
LSRRPVLLGEAAELLLALLTGGGKEISRAVLLALEGDRPQSPRPEDPSLLLPSSPRHGWKVIGAADVVPWGYAMCAVCLAEMGRLDEALAFVEDRRASEGALSFALRLGLRYAGTPEDWRRMLRRFIEPSDGGEPVESHGGSPSDATVEADRSAIVGAALDALVSHPALSSADFLRILPADGKATFFMPWIEMSLERARIEKAVKNLSMI